MSGEISQSCAVELHFQCAHEKFTLQHGYKKYCNLIQCKQASIYCMEIFFVCAKGIKGSVRTRSMILCSVRSDDRGKRPKKEENIQIMLKLPKSSHNRLIV